MTDSQTPAPPAPEQPRKTFADLGVHPAMVAALAEAGIERAFPIQEMTLPLALAGNDVIGQAKTGTGKTLGFGLPLLQRVIGANEPGYADLPAPGSPQALIVVPTRELAIQVHDDLARAVTHRGVKVLTVYGGRPIQPQMEALARGVEVVVGTPGRLLDLCGQRALSLKHIRIVVLDEADEMLDLGFLPDVQRILAQTPATRQTMLFSATMPGPVITMARQYMRRPTHIRANDPSDEGQTVVNTKQFVYRAHSMDKLEMLTRVLQAEGRGLTVVFAQTKRTCDKVVDDLTQRGFAAGAIHSDLGQGAREQALRAFRSGKVDVLVATDVAARGIDVDDVTHVVNYQCPDDEKTYLHRIGRTGRAGKTGVAVTLVDWDSVPRWKLINKTLGLPFDEPAETYSSSAHLYEELNIPRDAKGSLPESKRTRAGLAAEQLEDLGDNKKPRSSQSSGKRGDGRRSEGDGPRRRRSGSKGRQGGDKATAAAGSGSSAAGTSGSGEASGPERVGSGEAARAKRQRPRRRRVVTGDAAAPPA